ncbi:MAG TPA: class I SAM-dependent methyltransferase [Devosia sp.]|nr:class I SAM-dependent methyltransferase [Devosia sp.]
MPEIRFADGASYDTMMGVWSRSVGEVFLDWLAPPTGLDWIDVGCGGGAFTQLVAKRCAPRSIIGIDPSEQQITYARTLPLGGVAQFEQGDAMALPLDDGAVDIAASALVIHFMPDAAKGVAEMARVTKRGGHVVSYVWNIPEGGFPYAALNAAMKAAGFPPADTPQPPEAVSKDALRRLWTDAGLEAIEVREISVARTFANFEQYWQAAITAPPIAAGLAKAPASVVADVRERVRASLSEQPGGGEVVPTGRANAVRGRVR